MNSHSRFVVVELCLLATDRVEQIELAREVIEGILLKHEATRSLA